MSKMGSGRRCGSREAASSLGVVARTSRKSREKSEAAPVWALHGELTARPPGRLGRLLLPEIESYLEFFAIARGAG